MLWILPTESMPLRWQSSLVHTHIHTRNSTTSSLLWVISDPVLFLYTAVPKINRNLLLVRLIHQKKKKKKGVNGDGSFKHTHAALTHADDTFMSRKCTLTPHIHTRSTNTQVGKHKRCIPADSRAVWGAGRVFICAHRHTLPHLESSKKHPKTQQE